MLKNDGYKSQLSFVICLFSKLICQLEHPCYPLVSDTGPAEKYKEYYYSLISTYFGIFMASVNFVTEFSDSWILPISPFLNNSELILTPISNEDYVVGGPEIFLFTIFSLKLNLS